VLRADRLEKALRGSWPLARKRHEGGVSVLGTEEVFDVVDFVV
jgi:hypothetical protein